MWFSFMTGIGMNFKPLESKLIWSVVSFISERFLMCCLRVFLCLKFFGVFLLWFLIVHVWFFLLFSFPLLEAEKTYFSLCLFSTLVCFDIISENVLILAWISDANLCTSVLVITLLCLVANGALWFFFFNWMLAVSLSRDLSLSTLFCLISRRSIRLWWNFATQMPNGLEDELVWKSGPDQRYRPERRIKWMQI